MRRVICKNCFINLPNKCNSVRLYLHTFDKNISIIIALIMHHALVFAY